MVKQKKLSPVAEAMLGETKRKRVKRLRDEKPVDLRGAMVQLIAEGQVGEHSLAPNKLDVHDHRHELTTMRLDKLTARVVGCEDANGDIHVRLDKLEAGLSNLQDRVSTLVEHDTQASLRLDAQGKLLRQLERQVQDVYANDARMPAPKPAKTKRERWFNIYPDGNISASYYTERDAKNACRPGCLGQRKIEWEE